MTIPNAADIPKGVTVDGMPIVNFIEKEKNTEIRDVRTLELAEKNKGKWRHRKEPMPYAEGENGEVTYYNNIQIFRENLIRELRKNPAIPVTSTLEWMVMHILINKTHYASVKTITNNIKKSNFTYNGVNLPGSISAICSRIRTGLGNLNINDSFAIISTIKEGRFFKFKPIRMEELSAESWCVVMKETTKEIKRVEGIAKKTAKKTKAEKTHDADCNKLIDTIKADSNDPEITIKDLRSGAKETYNSGLNVNDNDRVNYEPRKTLSTNNVQILNEMPDIGEGDVTMSAQEKLITTIIGVLPPKSSLVIDPNGRITIFIPKDEV